MGLKKYFTVFFLMVLNFIFLAKIIIDLIIFINLGDGIRYMFYVEIGIFFVQLLICISILLSHRQLRFLRASFLFFMIGFLNTVYLSFNSVFIKTTLNLLTLSVVNILGILICVLSMHWDNLLGRSGSPIAQELHARPMYLKKNIPKKTQKAKKKKATKKKKTKKNKKTPKTKKKKKSKSNK